MRVEGQPAFVLHTRAWRETSVIVELLTRDFGRVGAVARGLTTPKRHPLRAALQPLQAIRVDFLPRGELARLIGAEAMDAAPQLTGDRLMAAFYVNELMIKLTPRNDAALALYELYARVRGELGEAGSLPWVLRRFERDLLDALGVGLPWDVDSADQDVHPDHYYRIDPELGLVALGQRTADSLLGAGVLALARDQQPNAECLGQLRRGLRAVLESHLGSAGLRSWGLLDELSRIKPRPGS